jgi:hypothetical protein
MVYENTYGTVTVDGSGVIVDAGSVTVSVAVLEVV